MKKIIGLTIAAMIVIAMVGVGTWAYFSDTETSSGNSFTAGTLNLVPTTGGSGPVGNYTVTAGGDGVVGNVVFVKVVPGEYGYIKWALTNNGNVDGYIDLESIAVTNAENYDAATNEAEAANDTDTSDATGVGELAANLDVVLFIDIDGDGVNESGDGDVQIYGGKLGSIASEYLQDLALDAGATANISMTWSIATTVNNTIQGDSATLTITFELGQTIAQ